MPVSATDAKLSKAERAEYAEHLNTIKGGLQTVARVVFSLRQIRDRKLFLGDYESFEDFVDGELRMSLSSAYRLLETEDVAEELADGNIPKHVSRAREEGIEEPQALTDSPPSPKLSQRAAQAIAEAAPKGERKALYQDVASVAPKDKGGQPKITATLVQKVAAKRKPEYSKDEVGHDIRHAHVTEAFEARPAFTSLMREVSLLKGKFAALLEGPAAKYAVKFQQQWDADVAHLHSVLRFSAPYAICPYCGGEKCNECKSTGWMNEDLYKAVPADIRGGGTK